MNECYLEFDVSYTRLKGFYDVYIKLYYPNKNKISLFRNKRIFIDSWSMQTKDNIFRAIKTYGGVEDLMLEKLKEKLKAVKNNSDSDYKILELNGIKTNITLSNEDIKALKKS